MKDEIKEILECLKEEDNYWSKQKHEYAWPDYYSLNREDLHILLDYITNLQEKCESLDEAYKNLQEELEVSQTNEETFRLEMQDITKCLGLDKHTIFDEVKEYATNLQEENESLYKELKLQKGTTRLFKNDLLNVMGNFMGTELDAFEQQEKELQDYKTRNEKAIEYIEKGNKHFKENYNEPYEYAFMVNADEIMKILKEKSDE